MLKYYNYDIVFQEIPNEVTLAVNITNCPNRCSGCHSKHLQQDIGIALNEDEVIRLIEKYDSAITCFCFMGGDSAPHKIAELAQFIQSKYSKLKVGWYSGCSTLPDNFKNTAFRYIKLGAYVAEFGNLKSKHSNQQLFEVMQNGVMKDISYQFRS